KSSFMSDMKDKATDALSDGAKDLIGDFAEDKIGKVISSGLSNKSGKLVGKLGKFIPKGGIAGAATLVTGALGGLIGGRKKDNDFNTNDNLDSEITQSSSIIKETIKNEIPEIEEVNTFN